MATIDQSHRQARGQSRLVAILHTGRFQSLLGFWQKINNDWVFNLSGMLAYNFLMSIFPILLVLLAVAGFALGNISPESANKLNNAIVGALPGNTGKFIVESLETRLRESAGLVFAIGLITAIYSGSRLFTSIEGVFGIIYRLRPRNFIQQNIMAIGMLVLYIMLVPIIVLASVWPATVVHLFLPAKSAESRALIYVLGIVAGFVAACLLFGATYVVVPNRHVIWRNVWKGTLVAAALLVLYELLFPYYSQNFLKPSDYGSLAGFAIVILVFFYYLGLILLLGAEVNAWALGQRPTKGDIPTLFHDTAKQQQQQQEQQPQRQEQTARQPARRDARNMGLAPQQRKRSFGSLAMSAGATLATVALASLLLLLGRRYPITRG